MKKILFVASEGVPFIKTGGLADVVGSLPKCIDKNYFDVRVVLPKYTCMSQEMKDKMSYVTHFYMDFHWKNEYVGVLYAEVDGVKYYFIDNGLLSLLLVDPTTTLLENIVAVALFRKYGNDSDNERVFFYNQNVEVDFYVPEEELAIQVSYSIEKSDVTLNREVDALQKLPKALPCKRRLILTYDDRKTLHDAYGTIEVMPCWDWLINF